MNMDFSKEGLKLINKPRGRSSFSIVAQVRRVGGNKKVGHAGTLDPEAEGLLIVLVGKEFTRQAANYSKLDKTYQFDIKLGEVSTTDDEEGEKTMVSKAKPSKQEIQAVIDTLVGRITQIPPIYSAIKIAGQRAYKIARSGQSVVMPPRDVIIKSFDIVSYKYPVVRLNAEVSSGTYIRSLAREIGSQLKTGAYCTKIVRTRIGQFSLYDATSID